MIEETVCIRTEPLTQMGEVTIVSGHEVLPMISDPEFLQQWNELYELCPWATIFQSSRFVVSWYTRYVTIHPPILVVSRYKGRLTGLLAMAGNIPELGIAGAGGDDAYYHLWLSYPDFSDTFIVEAIQKIRSVYPGKDVCLKYITPNTPVNWITENDSLKAHCVVRQFNRPILDINQVDEATVLSRKQFREKNNRLKRLGAVTFEVITDSHEFELALDGLLDHYDFRKAATYDITPFRDDPAKKGFLADLVKQGLLLAVSLKVNDEVCAMITATTPSKGWVHGAGIVVHNLKFSRVTPGYIIMKLFSVWLKRYPHVLYDITPGDHTYKNQHATSCDTLHELRITGSVKTMGYRTVYYATKVAKEILSKRQIHPEEIKLGLKRIGQALRHPAYEFAALNSALRPTKPTVWRLCGSGRPDTSSIRFKKDSIADLLLYNEREGDIPARVFMRNALTLYEQGNVLYTYSQHGSLKSVVWVSVRADHQRASLLANQELSIPADSVLLHCFYTFGMQPIQKLLQALALELQAEYPASELYIVSNSLSGNMGDLLQPVETV